MEIMLFINLVISFICLFVLYKMYKTIQELSKRKLSENVKPPFHYNCRLILSLYDDKTKDLTDIKEYKNNDVDKD